MRRKILCILVLMLLFSSIFPIVGSSRIFDDVIDQEQPIWTENEGYGIHNSNEKMAQSLKPTLNTLTRVQLVAGNFGSPSGNLFISIRDSLNGDDLASASISVHDIPPLEQSDWVEFDFPDISVIPEKSYYIIWHADALWDSSNFVIWRKHGNDPYLKGRLFWYNGLEWVDEYPTEDFCFRTYGLNNQPPNKPDKPYGETNGQVGKKYTYSTSTTDPDGDQVWYKWYWNDKINETSDWIGPYNSGETADASHIWNEKGDYNIRVKAKDVHGEESPWSDPLVVSMPKSKTINSQGLFEDGNIGFMLVIGDFTDEETRYIGHFSFMLFIGFVDEEFKFYTVHDEMMVLEKSLIQKEILITSKIIIVIVAE